MGKLVLTDTQSDENDTPLANLGLITGASQTFTEREPATFAKAYNDSELLDGQSAVFFESEDGNTPLGVSRTNFRINEDLLNGVTKVKDMSGNAVMEALYGTNRNIIGSGGAYENTTYLGLSAAILSDFSSRTSHTTYTAEVSISLRDGLELTLRNELGVDIDEEMLKLSVLENSYAAAARALNTIQEMFDSLEAAV